MLFSMELLQGLTTESSQCAWNDENTNIQLSLEQCSGLGADPSHADLYHT